MQRPLIRFRRLARAGRKLALAGFLLLLAFTSGCHEREQAHAGDTSAATGVQASQPAAQPPSLAPVDDHNPAHFVTSGPLVAEQQADLSFDQDGRVVAIHVQVGDHVKKGQVLAELDDEALQAECKSREARVASLKAQVAEWQAEQKADEADLRRADYMLAQHIRSQEDWEHIKYKLVETVAEVSRYQHDEAAAEADLQSAQVALDQTKLRAPFGGVVGRSSVRIAQQVKKGDVLFWITAEAPLQVLFTVPETLMSSFHTGAPLLLTTNDFPQLRQRARILRVSPVVDPASGSIQVVGLVVDRSPLLKPGMTMQVQLQP
ncbi:MAG: efflux RND transporter periplasmic adaptor subunit [Acidobacteriota bacterium]|nr:efflux RND transporter periplasmic adaptor subunit [Acidobacteriota bacterium]